MLKQLVNECRIKLIIKPIDPILVWSGVDTVDGPDLAFIRTQRRGEREPFIPGSSLKGVLRTQAERISRTLNSKGACDPFARDGEFKSCGSKAERNDSAEKIYRSSCPICKIFGSTGYAGRFMVSDGMVVPGSKVLLEARDGVGIDRFTGGSSFRAKFNLEVLTQGKFEAEIGLRNFELWQLGLIGYVLRDLQDGYISVGHGTSRGLGRIEGKIDSFALDYIGRKPEGKVWGMGVALPSNNGYRIVSPDEVVVDGLPEAEKQGIRYRLILKDDQIWNLFEKVAPRWNEFISTSEEVS